MTISSGNHVNVFEIPTIIRVANDEFDDLATAMRAATDSGGAVPILQFNHPRSQSRADKDYGRDDYPNERAWVAAIDPLVELIEVLNAPALKDGTGFRTHHHQTEYFRYLNLGFHVGPSVSHDNHYRNWGTSTDARVAVVAPSLTRANILRGLRPRHTYATEDRNLRVIFRANGALGGDIIAPPAAGSALALTVAIKDDDEPNAIYRVDVFQDVPGGPAASRPVETFEVRGNTSTPARLEGVRFSGLGEFVLLKLTQLTSDEHGEEDRVWTAPVWFEAADPAPLTVAGLPQLRIVSLVPNPAGDERTNEEITIRNEGSSPVNLTDWVLQDLAQQSWSLTGLGTLAPGQQATVRGNGQRMSLNNDGDTVDLIDPSGASVDTVEYGPANEGARLSPP